jgi:DNA polymerase
LDFETGSTVDIKISGRAHVSAHHAHVWCCAYQIVDDQGQTVCARHWRIGERLPDDLEYALEVGEVHAWNVAFELDVLRHHMSPRFGWPVPDLERCFCTMARARAAGLPGALKNAAPAAGIPVEKDLEGRKVMLRFAKPWKRTAEGPLWIQESPKYKPELFEKLVAYCEQDVRTEKALSDALPPLSKREREVWLTDYRINQNGVNVDRLLCEKALELREGEKHKADERVEQITDGELGTISSPTQLAKWLREQGVDADSVAKDAMAELLADELPDTARAVLELRADTELISVAKYAAMLKNDGDDVLRGIHAYFGAGSGRWAGRKVQGQNIARPELSDAEIDAARDMVKAGAAPDDLELLFGMSTMRVLSSCVRSALIPPPGRTFIILDWSNIEGRLAAWIAGEQWKLDAFRAFDASAGPDLYKVAAAEAIYHVPISEVTKAQRQVGKVSELSLQYEGGAGAFAAMAKNYGLELPPLKEVERIKEAWRARHPRIVAAWKAYNTAAISAIKNRGRVYTAPGVRFICTSSGVLKMLLPSGKPLWWHRARLVKDAYGRDAVKAWTVGDQGNWIEVDLYGGKVFNRAVQGVARDHLAYCLVEVEKIAGLKIHMHVHDEIVASVPGTPEDVERGLAAMAEIMNTPKWPPLNDRDPAEIPLAVDGGRASYYKK